MIRALLIVCFGLTYSSSGFGGNPNILQEVSDRLTAHDHLNGKFRQSKHLNFMDGPLVSSGSFTLGATEGLSWLVQKPLRSKMTVRNSRVMLDGKKVDDRGIGQFMAMIMEAFMTADVRGMEKKFTAEGDLLGSQWTVRLKPTSVMLRSVLSHIELRGNEFLEEITIFELDETFTRIEFSEVTGTDTVLQGRDAAST